MSRPNKKDFKLGDDDGSTNAFIESIAKSAPRKETLNEPLNTDRGSEPWTSDIYSTMERQPRRRSGQNCKSVCVLIFSLLVSLTGVGLIIIAAIQKEKKLMPLCPNCNKTLLVMYIFGASIVCLGILGIIAAKTRSKLCAIPYVILLVLMGVAFIVLSILVIVFQANVSTAGMSAVWHDDIENDPSGICELQKRYECSGFKHGCCNFDNINDSNNTKPLFELFANEDYGICYNKTNGVPPKWVSEDCVTKCEYNIYNTTCASAIQKDIKSHLGIILGVLISIALIDFVLAFLSCRMTRIEEHYE